MSVKEHSLHKVLVTGITIFLLVTSLPLFAFYKITVPNDLFSSLSSKIIIAFKPTREYVSSAISFMDEKLLSSFLPSVNEKLHVFIVDEKKRVNKVAHKKFNPIVKDIKVLTKSFGVIKLGSIKKTNLLNNVADM